MLLELFPNKTFSGFVFVSVNLALHIVKRKQTH